MSPDRIFPVSVLHQADNFVKVIWETFRKNIVILTIRGKMSYCLEYSRKTSSLSRKSYKICWENGCISNKAAAKAQ